MKTINNDSIKMDLSSMPADIIPIIAKHLLLNDNNFRFNKIFRKKNYNNLLKFFFGLDDDVFRYVNNFVGFYNQIECKEIYLNPSIDCINDTCNTEI